MPGVPAKLQVPRWIQLVGLPLILILAWSVAGHVRHVVFLFLVASLVALLLSPLVRRLARLAHVPRGVAVAVVYGAFLLAVLAALGGIGTVVVDQTRTAGSRVDSYFTRVDPVTRQVAADHDVDRLQAWLDKHGLRVDVQTRGHKLVTDIRKKDVGKYTQRAVNFVEGAAVSIGRTIFNLVLIIVVSVYMLLDMPRLARTLDRRFPPRPGSLSLLVRMERALAGYVKGQLLLSLIIGASAGLGLWIFDVLGLLPGIGSYILLFAAWVAFTELIPYVGPWIGGIPAFIYALFVMPLSAIWVALLFLFIHQVEGHVVIPNVMSRAVRLHPLLVIFGLLAGLEIYGMPGVLVALPLLASARATWEFFSERVELQQWGAGAGGPLLVEVQLDAVQGSPDALPDAPPDAPTGTSAAPPPSGGNGSTPLPDGPPAAAGGREDPSAQGAAAD